MKPLIIKTRNTAFIICAVISLEVQAIGASADLNQLCPVEWQAVPLLDAIRDLAKRLEIPYVLDSSVSDEVLSRPVRLLASKLTGRQAFRWTVRVAGLDAVLVNGAMMIAVPDRLPLAWRAMGSDGSDAAFPQSRGTSSTADEANREAIEAESRQVDLNWMDAPLSRVSRDISERFGVDVIFHPAIHAEQPLIRLEGTKLNFQAIRQAFSEQIHATSRYEDGVLWIEPAGVASRSAMDIPCTTSVSEVALPSSAVLGKVGVIEIQATDWKVAEQVFGQSGGVNCRIESLPGSTPPLLTARGTVSEVLEGMRLLSGWKWRLEPMGSDEQPTLVIEVADRARPPG